MAIEASKTQIDRLGVRLRKGNISEADLRLLDEYRRSFSAAYEFVVGTIQQRLQLEPTGRPAKSTTSISDKLARESIRFSQIQDIAGCRLVVSDVAEQDRVVEALSTVFEEVEIVDRRDRPSHGYRAVHLIIKTQGKLVEVQVRTVLQHAWAELSEKLSDVVNPAIKYGGGDPNDQELLKDYGGLIVDQESFEVDLAREKERLSALLSQGSLHQDEQDKILESRQNTEDVENQVFALRQRTLELLRTAIAKLPKRNQ